MDMILDLLKKYNQEHIIKILEKLDGERKENLIKQIKNIDFEEMNRLYNSTKEENKLNCTIEPIGFIDKAKLTDEEREKLSENGVELIKNGGYAVVTMAGGQGTRLGFNGPKGTFKLDVTPEGKYIFEILLDTIKEQNRKYNSEIYWYIMTSKENNDDTIRFFEEHNYFGYNKEKVKFFKQFDLPLMSLDGKLLLNDRFEIKEASDGNGGVFKAMKKEGILDDMKSKGIKWVYISGVDNIMVKPVDSIFVGLAMRENVQCATKSIVKSYPEEKVGAFCKKNGKPGVVEYMEMNDEMIYGKNEDGELLYGESHIVSNMFSIDALEIIANEKLEYHCAKKKNSHIDEDGNLIVAKEPNSYKFESFIFDAFQFFNDLLIMRVDRNREFAPIKNASGIDSPESAKEIYFNCHNK